MPIQPNDVRTWIKDKPEYNRLLDKEEFSQEQIDQAMKLTVMAYNEFPPLTQFTVSNFPYQYTLLIGTVYHLFFGGGISRSRNRLSYQTDGVTIDDEAHADVELQLSQSLWAMFMDFAKNQKVQENVKNGWGHVRSQYSGVAFYQNYRD